VDANEDTVAGYLSQYDEDVECPLAFFSLKLNGTQKMWAAVHKEAYAVIAALKKFRNWVFWQKFIFILTTIHSPF